MLHQFQGKCFCLLKALHFILYKYLEDGTTTIVNVKACVYSALEAFVLLPSHSLSEVA